MEFIEVIWIKSWVSDPEYSKLNDEGLFVTMWKFWTPGQSGTLLIQMFLKVMIPQISVGPCLYDEMVANLKIFLLDYWVAPVIEFW